jgi:hypothetical protein
MERSCTPFTLMERLAGKGSSPYLYVYRTPIVFYGLVHLDLLWVQQFKGHLLELLLKLFPLRGKLALLRAKKPGEGELVMLGMLMLGPVMLVIMLLGIMLVKLEKLKLVLLGKLQLVMLGMIKMHILRLLLQQLMEMLVKLGLIKMILEMRDCCFNSLWRC